ncbi:hypothetical protein NHX12_026257 [Muraenolepis orangiensis]|uniref:Uncharacterized protein n=1 Tax=Muraenolepis orangiensis TaxID=630683 RepID=A0A9Q0EJJ6_9TELE|nr:hypothetical protein NHX12_026257 [Muraenolepis orangiensis]
MKKEGLSWQDLERRAQDRRGWRSFVVSQTSPNPSNTSVSANPNNTMTTNSYSGNSTNTTAGGGAPGSLHAGFSSLLPTLAIAALSFLHRFC